MTESQTISNGDAWAAGLFEGEGSITFSRGQIQLKLATTDEDVIRRFADVVGCGQFYVREEMRKAHYKSCWYWYVSKRSEVCALMERFLPLLGERRTARWHEVCAKRDALRPEAECPQCGEMFKPIRIGQVCCGHDCSWRYSARVGKYTDRAQHQSTVTNGYASQSSERRARLVER